MIKHNHILSILMMASIMLTPFFGANSANAQTSAVRTIVFPVIGTVTYYDDFGAPRGGGTRSHEGNDLMGKKMLPLVAAVDGTITNVNYPEASWGMAVTIKDKDGYTYHYIHMNNDNPGTDDGKGGGFNAYAPDVKEGNKVVKGQLLGYMGDSGNAETTQAHLHFEIRYQGAPINPYRSLQNATKITTPVPAPKQDGEIVPYEGFSGAVSVAAANLDKDSSFEYVTGAGPGGGPLVKAFDTDGDQIAAFYAYGENFSGGIDVAAADIDEDGRAEIITAPGKGGGPHIKIFKTNGTLVREFFAYDTNFTGGVNISAADMDNDKKAEIVTAPGAGGGPHVKVFNADGTLKHELLAYDSSFSGGVDVAAIPHARASSTRRTTRSGSGSTAAGGFATVPGKGGGPHVKVFDKDAKLKDDFQAFESNFNLGLRIAAGNASTGTSGIELAVVPASGGGPHAKLFSTSGRQIFSGVAGFESWWSGGYDIALREGGGVIASGGNRRSSLRETTFKSTSTRDRSRTNND